MQVVGRRAALGERATEEMFLPKCTHVLSMILSKIVGPSAAAILHAQERERERVCVCVCVCVHGREIHGRETHGRIHRPALCVCMLQCADCSAADTHGAAALAASTSEPAMRAMICDLAGAIGAHDREGAPRGSRRAGEREDRTARRILQDDTSMSGLWAPHPHLPHTKPDPRPRSPSIGAF